MIAVRDSLSFTACCLQLPLGSPASYVQDNILQTVKEGYEAAQRGELAEFPTIEWYCQTLVDPTLTDEHGRISSALFVQWVPHDLKGSTWEAEEEKYVKHLLSIW